MENLKQEQKESAILINKGFEIKLCYKVTKRKFLFWEETKTEIKNLTFKEPTLAVLDIVTDRFLRLEITEPQKNAEPAEVLRTANLTATNNAEKMAEIIAVFALGENVFDFDGRKYHYNAKRVLNLTKKIFHNIKPSLLISIVSQLTALSNLPNFLHSIRLTGANRTTTPAALVE